MCYTMSYLIDRQVDLISYFQASIESSYVKHVASSDLHVLHREFCFLYKEGNAPSEQGKRPRGGSPARGLSCNWKGLS